VADEVAIVAAGVDEAAAMALMFRLTHIAAAAANDENMVRFMMLAVYELFTGI
jgi:hypothetical protein